MSPIERKIEADKEEAREREEDLAWEKYWKTKSDEDFEAWLELAKRADLWG